MVDVTAWRAYSAEHSLPPQRPLPDLPAVDRFVRRVVSSDLWNDLVPFPHQIYVTEAPYEAHESWLERDRSFEYRSATLAVHPDKRWTLNLLHELAHGASPRYRYVPDSSGHEWPPHLELHPHGGLWASTYLRLVRDFAPTCHSQLREAYEHYEVMLVDDDTLLDAVRESRRAERELTEWDASVTGDARAWSYQAIRLQQDDPSRSLQPSLANLIVTGAFRAGDPDRSVNRMFDPIADMSTVSSIARRTTLEQSAGTTASRASMPLRRAARPRGLPALPSRRSSCSTSTPSSSGPSSD